MQLLQCHGTAAFVAISSAHRAIHLRHSEWRSWQKLAGFCSYVIELLAMCDSYSLLKGIGVSSPGEANFFI